MTDVHVIAAVPDAWIIGFGVFQTLFAALVSYAIWRLSQAQRRYERSEDAANEKIKRAETQLHETTTKLVDERFRALSHDMANSVNHFKLTLESMTHEMEEAHKTIERLCQDDHALELSTVKQIAEIRERMMTRDDFNRLKEELRRV